MKPSSKITAATAPVGGTTAQTTFTFNASAAPYNINTLTVNEVSAISGILGDDAITIDADEEGVSIKFFERVNGQKVVAELQPESDLRPIEQLRISMIITAGQECLQSFKPITLIRRYGIERHFRFTAT